MDIKKELQQIIAMKSGNKEMALFYEADGEWSLSLGNPSKHVMLGEVAGEFEISGSSIEDVIIKMKLKLNEKI